MSGQIEPINEIVIPEALNIPTATGAHSAEQTLRDAVKAFNILAKEFNSLAATPSEPVKLGLLGRLAKKGSGNMPVSEGGIFSGTRKAINKAAAQERQEAQRKAMFGTGVEDETGGENADQGVRQRLMNFRAELEQLIKDAEKFDASKQHKLISEINALQPKIDDLRERLDNLKPKDPNNEVNNGYMLAAAARGLFGGTKKPGPPEAKEEKTPEQRAEESRAMAANQAGVEQQPSPPPQIPTSNLSSPEQAIADALAAKESIESEGLSGMDIPPPPPPVVSSASESKIEPPPGNLGPPNPARATESILFEPQSRPNFVKPPPGLSGDTIMPQEYYAVIWLEIRKVLKKEEWREGKEFASPGACVTKEQLIKFMKENLNVDETKVQEMYAQAEIKAKEQFGKEGLAFDENARVPPPLPPRPTKEEDNKPSGIPPPPPEDLSDHITKAKRVKVPLDHIHITDQFIDKMFEYLASDKSSLNASEKQRLEELKSKVRSNNTNPSKNDRIAIFTFLIMELAKISDSQTANEVITAARVYAREQITEYRDVEAARSPPVPQAANEAAATATEEGSTMSGVSKKRMDELENGKYKSFFLQLKVGLPIGKVLQNLSGSANVNEEDKQELKKALEQKASSTSNSVPPPELSAASATPATPLPSEPSAKEGEPPVTPPTTEFTKEDEKKLAELKAKMSRMESEALDGILKEQGITKQKYNTQVKDIAEDVRGKISQELTNFRKGEEYVQLKKEIEQLESKKAKASAPVSAKTEVNLEDPAVKAILKFFPEIKLTNASVVQIKNAFSSRQPNVLTRILPRPLTQEEFFAAVYAVNDAREGRMDKLDALQALTAAAPAGPSGKAKATPEERAKLREGEAVFEVLFKENVNSGHNLKGKPPMALVQIMTEFRSLYAKDDKEGLQAFCADKLGIPKDKIDGYIKTCQEKVKANEAEAAKKKAVTPAGGGKKPPAKKWSRVETSTKPEKPTAAPSAAGESDWRNGLQYLGPKYEKYARMAKSGLPEGAIRNAMARDGVDVDAAIAAAKAKADAGPVANPSAPAAAAAAPAAAHQATPAPAGAAADPAAAKTPPAAEPASSMSAEFGASAAATPSPSSTAAQQQNPLRAFHEHAEQMIKIYPNHTNARRESGLINELEFLGSPKGGKDTVVTRQVPAETPGAIYKEIPSPDVPLKSALLDMMQHGYNAAEIHKSTGPLVFRDINSPEEAKAFMQAYNEHTESLKQDGKTRNFEIVIADPGMENLRKAGFDPAALQAEFAQATPPKPAAQQQAAAPAVQQKPHGMTTLATQPRGKSLADLTEETPNKAANPQEANKESNHAEKQQAFQNELKKKIKDRKIH